VAQIITSRATRRVKVIAKGGEGSGYFGHAGRPGQEGGSAPGDAVASEEQTYRHGPSWLVQNGHTRLIKADFVRSLFKDTPAEGPAIDFVVKCAQHLPESAFYQVVGLSLSPPPDYRGWRLPGLMGVLFPDLVVNGVFVPSTGIVHLNVLGSLKPASGQPIFFGARSQKEVIVTGVLSHELAHSLTVGRDGLVDAELSSYASRAIEALEQPVRGLQNLPPVITDDEIQSLPDNEYTRRMAPSPALVAYWDTVERRFGLGIHECDSPEEFVAGALSVFMSDRDGAITRDLVQFLDGASPGMTHKLYSLIGVRPPGWASKETTSDTPPIPRRVRALVLRTLRVDDSFVTCTQEVEAPEDIVRGQPWKYTLIEEPATSEKGGEGSGYFGHAGRPGQEGGSAPSDSVASSAIIPRWRQGGELSIGSTTISQEALGAHLKTTGLTQDILKGMFSLPGRVFHLELNKSSLRYVGDEIATTSGRAYDLAFAIDRNIFDEPSYDQEAWLLSSSTDNGTLYLFPSTKDAEFEWMSLRTTGGGVGTAIMRNVMQGLADAGYEKMHIVAGLSIGRYAWAKAGFEYADSNMAQKVTERFVTWATRAFELNEDEVPDGGWPIFHSPLDVANYKATLRGQPLNLIGQDIENFDVPGDMLLEAGKAFMLDLTTIHDLPVGHGAWKSEFDLTRLRARSKSVGTRPIRVRVTYKGGEGSGNFDHAGRPGEVGGSAPSSSGSNTSAPTSDGFARTRNILHAAEIAGFAALIGLSLAPDVGPSKYMKSNGVESLGKAAARALCKDADNSHREAFANIAQDLPKSAFEYVKDVRFDRATGSAAVHGGIGGNIGVKAGWNFDSLTGTLYLDISTLPLITGAYDETRGEISRALATTMIDGRAADTVRREGGSPDDVQKWTRSVRDATDSDPHIVTASQLITSLKSSDLFDIARSKSSAFGLKPADFDSPRDLTLGIYHVLMSDTRGKATPHLLKLLEQSPGTLDAFSMGEKSVKILVTYKGGQGSGNFDHAGRPGEVGGSAPSGSAADSGSDFDEAFNLNRPLPDSLDKDLDDPVWSGLIETSRANFMESPEDYFDDDMKRAIKNGTSGLPHSLEEAVDFGGYSFDELDMVQDYFYTKLGEPSVPDVGDRFAALYRSFIRDDMKRGDKEGLAFGTRSVKDLRKYVAQDDTYDLADFAKSSVTDRQFLDGFARDTSWSLIDTFRPLSLAARQRQET
jgi:hypothetical protein